MKLDNKKLEERSLSLFQMQEILKTILKHLDLDVPEDKIHSGIKKFFKN